MLKHKVSVFKSCVHTNSNKYMEEMSIYDVLVMGMKYKIPIEEAYRYLRKKELKNKLPGDYQERIKKYYEDKLKSYDDLITSKDIRTITGYGKEAIRNWINSEKILGVVCRGKFRVAKDDLLDFLISPYYFSIARKSKTHIEDFKKIGGFKNG